MSGTGAATRTLSGFSLRADTSPSGGGASTTITASGTLSSTALGSMSVSISTVNPFVTAPGAACPGSGWIAITGAAGSQARLTVQNASMVLIELDANGDGAFQESQTMPWSDIG